jgi:tRNA A-37 threonylcarbamoyl transferase component Bud32
MLQIQCPGCAERFKYSEQHSGCTVSCLKCGTKIALTAAAPSNTILPLAGETVAHVNNVAPPRRVPSQVDKESSSNPSKSLKHATTATPSAKPIVIQQLSAKTLPTATELPKRIGRFEIVSKLGSGAFGVVYRAIDPVLKRDVALKVPHASLLQNEEVAKRLIQEPQAAAQLQHPNIVAVFDAGIDGDNYFIASAFIEGRTLDGITKGKCIPGQKAALVVMKLAGALHYAHSKGIVHRDVKPANIMVDKTGEPYLMDFGIARWEHAEQKLTVDSAMLGTPAYMSPEQAGAADGKIGPASDQYSLGVVFYELLCGARPFSWDQSVPALLHEIREKQPVSPRIRNPEVTQDLETICLKAMSKSQRDRYANCHELAEDLRRYIADEPIMARRMGVVERLVRWTRRNPAIAGLTAAVVLVTVVGFAAVAWQWREAVTQRSLAEQRLELVTKAQSERGQAQLDALLRAEIGQVPLILESLRPFREEIAPRLAELASRKHLSDKERLHVSLALLRTDARQVSYLRDRLLTAQANEVFVIREALVGQSSGLAEHFWNIVEDKEAELSRRFRAACALALFDPTSARWATHSGKLAEILVQENPLHLSQWLEALRPVSNSLTRPLAAIYADSSRRESERTLATQILADYAADQPEVLVDSSLCFQNCSLMLLRV